MRDIEVGDHVWYELRQEIDRGLGSRTVVEMRAVVERVCPDRHGCGFLVIRPYVGTYRNRAYGRARRVGSWKVRPY